MNTRTYKSVEARSAAALHLKVLSKKATGWTIDGPALEVTDFCNGKRPITRYSQAMFKAKLYPATWGYA